MPEETTSPPPGQNPGEVKQGRDGGLRENDSLGTDADIDTLESELGDEDTQ